MLAWGWGDLALVDGHAHVHHALLLLDECHLLLH